MNFFSIFAQIKGCHHLVEKVKQCNARNNRKRISKIGNMCSFIQTLSPRHQSPTLTRESDLSFSLPGCRYQMVVDLGLSYPKPSVRKPDLQSSGREAVTSWRTRVRFAQILIVWDERYSIPRASSMVTDLAISSSCFFAGEQCLGRRKGFDVLSHSGPHSSCHSATSGYHRETSRRV